MQVFKIIKFPCVPCILFCCVFFLKLFWFCLDTTFIQYFSFYELCACCYWFPALFLCGQMWFMMLFQFSNTCFVFSMWSVLEKISMIPEKKVYSLVVRYNILQISVRTIWFMILNYFKILYLVFVWILIVLVRLGS